MTDTDNVTALDFIERGDRALSAALAVLRRAVDKLRAVKRERDEARANARVLAHAYRSDNRPPHHVVFASLAYPLMPEPS